MLVSPHLLVDDLLLEPGPLLVRVISEILSHVVHILSKRGFVLNLLRIVDVRLLINQELCVGRLHQLQHLLAEGGGDAALPRSHRVRLDVVLVGVVQLASDEV